MKFLFVALLCIFSGASALLAQDAAKDSALFNEAKTAIAAGNKQWIASFEGSKPEGIVALFASDGCMFSGNGKVTRGIPGISERVGKMMNYFGTHVKVTVKTLHIWLVDVTAYETGEYSYTSLQDGKETVDGGHYTTIWQKQKDGSWKIIRDMSVE